MTCCDSGHPWLSAYLFDWVLFFLWRQRKKPRKPPRNQSALRVPDPAQAQMVTALPLSPFVHACLGKLLAWEEKLFYPPPPRFAKVVLKKVATSCRAATAFLSAALGTRKVNCGSTLRSYARESALGQRTERLGGNLIRAVLALRALPRLFRRPNQLSC